jgi:excinuclease ABC subunit C
VLSRRFRRALESGLAAAGGEAGESADGAESADDGVESTDGVEPVESVDAGEYAVLDDAGEAVDAGEDAVLASAGGAEREQDAAPGDGWAAPDLLVVDGGKGQLNQALAALKDLGIAITAEKGFDVIGLAKERDTSGETLPDRVFLRNRKDSIQLRPNTAELFLLSRIRDEAHRFANTFHRERRKRAALRSSLDDIPGIGQKRRRALLRHFGSLKAIKQATLEELTTVAGMSRKAAEAVRRFFDAGEPPTEAAPATDTPLAGDALPSAETPPDAVVDQPVEVR